MSEFSNETVRNIITRRSVRKYKPQKPDEAVLKTILDAALFAPTGGNCQETRFIVITSDELLEKFSTLVKDTFASRPLDPTQYQNKSAIAARKPGYDFRYHAPVMIHAVAPRTHGNSMADSALAIENMMLAAHSIGLGSCYVNQVHWLTEDTGMRRLLCSAGMKETEDCFGSIIIGYPDTEPLTHQPPRKEDRIVFA